MAVRAGFFRVVVGGVVSGGFSFCGVADSDFCFLGSGTSVGVSDFFASLAASVFFGGGMFSWAWSGVMEVRARVAQTQVGRRYLNMGWVGEQFICLQTFIRTSIV